MSLLNALMPLTAKNLDNALASYGAILLYRHFQDQPSRSVENALHTWLNGDKPVLLDAVQSLEISFRPVPHEPDCCQFEMIVFLLKNESVIVRLQGRPQNILMRLLPEPIKSEMQQNGECQVVIHH